MTGFQSQINVLADNIDSVETISQYTQDLVNVKSDIIGLNSSTSSIDGRVTTNEANINTNSNKATTNEGNITTLNGKVTTNSNDISSINGRVTTAEGKISVNENGISTNLA